MPVNIDEIESDIELQGESTQDSAPTQVAASSDHSIDVMERRARDEERTQAWDFDD